MYKNLLCCHQWDMAIGFELNMNMQGVGGPDVQMARNKSNDEEVLGDSTVSSTSSSTSCHFPIELVEHVLAFLTSHKDRNAASLVCKAWFRVEASTRRRVFVGNCYACSPQIVSRRFPRVQSLTLKGKPRFSDFGLVPSNWGANVMPWVLELAIRGPLQLEELRLKRMTVTDECLDMIARCFPNFRILSLTFCDGFSTDGLSMIASQCRFLNELELQECLVEDRGSRWIGAFPETFTSLTSLNLTSFNSGVNFEDLERLVARCTKLEKLKLGHGTTVDQLTHLLVLRGPNLIELGTGSFIHEGGLAELDQFGNLFSRCDKLRSLSGFFEMMPFCLPLIYPIVHNLLFLELSESPVGCVEFTELISHCSRLQCLWVQDLVEDRGLEAVARTCLDLQELRVVPCDPSQAEHSLVTEKGLVAISRGCRSLRYLLFFCNQMTNSALQEFASNCSRMTHVRICIMKPWKADYTTEEPMDEGFGAVVQHCERLRRLSVSGLLTDRAFELIGKHAKELRSLSVAFAGESSASMMHVMQGCGKLKKLEIRDSPFGDEGLLAGVRRLYSMRSLWMSSCNLSLRGCKLLAEQLPMVNVEIIVEDESGHPLFDRTGTCKAGDEDEMMRVEKLYVYRSIAGARSDAPSVVYTL